MDPIVLTGPALDDLPGLDSVLSPSQWRAEASRAIQSALDPDTDHKKPRKVKFVVSFTPEADGRSALSATKISAALPGGKPPKPRRFVMDDAERSLRVGVMLQEPEEVTVFEPPPIDHESIPDYRELWGGRLDEQWKRALVRVMLSIGDTRADPKATRKIEIEIGLDTDEARSILRWSIRKVQAHIAPAEKIEPSISYIEPRAGVVALAWEPISCLPGGEGRQEAVPGTVVSMNDRRPS